MQPRPVGYRSEIVGPILRALSAGECCSVVGMSGVGKTNLIGQLQRPDVQRQHLGAAEPLAFVVLDSNMLAAHDGWGLLEGLLEALAAGAADEALREQARRCHAEVLQDRGNAPLALRRAGEALALACERARVALIFDEFDPLFVALESAALRNLRGLRDRHKYRLTMLTFTRQRLPDLREGDWDAVEPFVELLTLHELGLGPLARADSLDEAGRIAGRHGQALAAGEAERVAALSGGHPALIRALVGLALAGPGALAAEPALLAGHPALRPECAKIWQQLDGDEQDGLRALAAGRGGPPPAGLLLKGLARAEQGAALVFSPLLAHYIRQIDQPAAGTAAIQIDLERRQVVYYGQDISGTLTRLEYPLLAYLWQRYGAICPLPEVAQAVYGDEFRVDPGTTPLELSDELERLRALARRLGQRLARLTPAGSPPLFTIHRMRGLRLGPPA